ncbi:type IV toxin-antitoxin system AbiEi family antitoxin domain-containing protein [Geobacillus thermodenitrificans]|uniref:type IV toxin-antitoxin system AbiEi family antitoxin domain-containing protein n=1 Tax=Geobacillus TaxID=129337 RepID=UPI000C05A387|nr:MULTISPECIES: type IV toxin-antitoxin system AbiEi family antitoxin domain-containing protein [Geobacillus]ATO37822.1 Abortive infection protein AbiEi [Geobacillus thermodenitrificans]NNU88913.1 Abortive infection protein AbiEi [Geobacillus sp. MR]
MSKEVSKIIKDIFVRQKGFAKTEDLTREGVSKYYIRKFEQNGEIIRIKRGLYRYAEFENDQNEEVVEVSKVIPNGVLCLLSALSFYELTTYNPWEYQIAIERKSRKPSLPDYPPIKIFYFSKKQFEYGIEEVEVGGHKISIYNREKTICDIIRYREKIGIDLMKEGLRNYLQSPEKNISKLVECAEKMRIKTVLLKYLEVLL